LRRYSLQRLLQEKNLGGATGGAEQLAKSFEPLTPEVTQLLAVAFLQRLVEPAQQLESWGCNAGQDDAPVLGVVPSGNQAALFQTVQQAGDVGIASDHALGDFAAGQAFWCATQDAQDVVLVRGEVFGFEQRDEAATELVRSAEELQEGGFLGGGWSSGTGGAWSCRCHTS
jgi:hypothetical protein